MPQAASDRCKLYYEAHGAGGEVPLVLVTGLGGSYRGWLPLQVPEFSRERRVVIFDHRGVGESGDPGGPFTTADLADDLAGLLTALAIERADVLGTFLGGMVAQELALRHPARVRRLILVGSYARPDAKRRLLLEHWRETARRGADLALLVRERLLWTLEDTTLEQTDLVEAMMARFQEEGFPMSRDLFMRQCDACLLHDTHARLGEIHCPTLVAYGRNDQLTPPKLQRELAEGIPDARPVAFAYGGHLILAESAERFHETVRHFLSEANAPSGQGNANK